MSLKLALIFFALIIIFCLFHQISGQIFFEYELGDYCTTPNKQSGVCRLLTKCEHLLEAFERKDANLPAQKQYFRNAKCKFDNDVPIVCCDTDTGPCITPEDQIGTCVPMDRCPILTNFFRLNSKRRDYKEVSRCEYEGAREERFCCPIFTNIISGNIIVPQNLSALPIDEEDYSDEENVSVQNMPNTLKLPENIQSVHLIAGDGVIPAQNRISLPKPGESLDQCGTHEIADKIINGDVTDIYEFPWMALLRMGNGEFACGASLINNRYILTAAHCVRGVSVRNKNNVTMVRLGEWDLDSDRDCVRRSGDQDECTPEPVDIPPEEIIVHNGYVESTLENDIALIRLRSNVIYSEFIKSICLPTVPLDIQKDENFTVAGWGATEMGSQSSKKLFLNNLFQSESSKCGRDTGIKEGQLCIASRISQGTCNGDSGGPLMIVRKVPALAAIFYQVGIVSYGTTTHCGQRPNVYTKVENYMNWIINNMKP